MHYQPLNGDLTRLGYLSENDYGWNAPQPVQTIFRMPMQDPEILVVGDSFSTGNTWQSRLKELSGLGSVTLHLRDFLSSPYCTVKAAVEKYPTLDILIIQSVERSAVSRMQQLVHQSEDCAQFEGLNEVQTTEGVTSPKRKTEGYISDFAFLGKMFFYERWKSGDLWRQGQSYVAKLDRPDLFSNENGDHFVFYEGDITSKSSWKNADIKKAFESFHRYSVEVSAFDLEPVLLVTPDKSTVYEKFLVAKNILPKSEFWQLMATTEAPVINLKPVFLTLSEEMIDFYLPNDTHMSVSAYQEMARIIHEYIHAEGLK